MHAQISSYLLRKTERKVLSNSFQYMSCTFSPKLKNEQLAEQIRFHSLSRFISINCSPLDFLLASYLGETLVAKLSFLCNFLCDISLILTLHFKTILVRGDAFYRLLPDPPVPTFSDSPFTHISISSSRRAVRVAPRLSVKWHRRRRRRLLVSTHLMGLGHRKDPPPIFSASPQVCIHPHSPPESAVVCHFYNYFCYF